jgi:methylated-DNA-[protein]-cysteine S-methyltransferase
MNLDKKIYIKLLEVPEGMVTSYLDLSKAVGLKNGQRAIGKIMNKNKHPVIIPCHRVVKSDGCVGGYAYGENVKTNMLTKEGIEIKNGKIVDIKTKMYKF